MASLQSRLTPYFHMDHPTRGPLFGPYKKLPSLLTSHLRRLVLDTASTILASDRQTEASRGLSKAVGLAVTGEEEEAYWSHLSVSCLYFR
jgi:pre-rRNA-processing protein IPI1